jgi:YVTN family beta-propeller protein
VDGKHRAWLAVVAIVAVAAVVMAGLAILAIYTPVTATIPVGSNPGAVVYDSGKREVFVANLGSGSVSVISDATNAVVATVNVGMFPSTLAYISGKGEVFVGTDGNVSVISDTSNKVVATVHVGITFGMAYDSGKGEVFVSDGEGTYIISDITNAIVASVPAAGGSGLAYDSGKGEVFVAGADFVSVDSTSLSVISDKSDTVVKTIYVGPDKEWLTGAGLTQGVAYDSSMGEIFVGNVICGSAMTCGPNGEVNVISDRSNQVVATIPIDGFPTGLAYDGEKGEVFVANDDSNTVSIISDTPYAIALLVGMMTVVLAAVSTLLVVRFYKVGTCSRPASASSSAKGPEPPNPGP